MQRYNSQKWKRLIPDEGMEICERYILRQSTSWWRNLLPLKLAKSNIVILEIYQMEAQFVNLGIRIYIGNGESVQKLAVHKIMQAFFANN